MVSFFTDDCHCMNNKETEGQSGPQVLTVLLSQNGVGVSFLRVEQSLTCEVAGDWDKRPVSGHALSWGL